MPLRVRVPVHVRWADPAGMAVDGSPDADRRTTVDALENGLSRALERALEPFRQQVLAPRHGHAQIRPFPPEFTWVDPGGQVTSSWREVVQQRCGRAIAVSLATLEVEALAASEALPERAHERVDAHRLRGINYRLHSYNGTPDDVDTPIAPPAEMAAEDGWETTFWFWNGSDEELLFRMWVIARNLLEGAHPRRLGILFRGQRDGVQGVFAATAALRWRGAEPTIDVSSVRYWFVLDRFRVVGANGPEPRSEPANGRYQLELLARYAGADALRERALASMLALESLTSEPLSSDTPEQARRRAVIARAVEQFVSDYGTASNMVFARLSTPLGTPYFVAVPAQAFQDQEHIELLGAWDTARRAREGDGEGDGGEAGRTEGRGSERSESNEGAEGGSPFAEVDPNADPDRDPNARVRYFPRLNIGGETLELDLSPFLGEPNVNEIGPPGQALKRLIQRIAYQLEIPEGEYTGAFLIAAAQVIGARSSLAGQAAVVMPRATRLAEPGTGNLGDLDITPEHTPVVQLLRHVAGTCRLVTELTRTMGETYRLPEIRDHYLSRYRGRPDGWMLHFHLAHTPAMKDSIAALFVRSCQVVMLQVLRTSRVEIDRRLDNFDDYFEVFSVLMTGLVAQEAELRELRDTLMRVQNIVSPSLQSTVSSAYTSWREARQAFSSALSDQILNASEVLDGPDLPRGTPVRRADGTWIVRDSHDREWTLQDLETAIALRNGTASAVDPLIQQLTNIPDVVDVFRNRPWLARHYLRQLLTEMQQNNATIEREVTGSAIYAFRSGRIREDLPNRTVAGTSVALQGIHLLAHEAVNDAFGSDRWYGIGLDWLFSAELGRASLLTFAEFGLVMSISVLCPPVGVALGVAIAQVHMDQAEERMTIYRSVLNPEDLYNHAELELDLFLAELELVLSIVPELGSIGRGVSRAGGTLARRGVRSGMRHLTVQARRALVVSIARQVRAGLGRAFVNALVTDRVMSLILPQVLGPVIGAVEAEIRMRTTGSSAASETDASTTSTPVDTAADGGTEGAEPAGDSTERPLSPEGIEFYGRLDEYTPSPTEEHRTRAEDQP